MPLNQYNQPVGESLPDWRPAITPVPCTISGRFCCLKPLEPDNHFQALYKAYQTEESSRSWTYLPYEKPESPEIMHALLSMLKKDTSLLPFAVIPVQTGTPAGFVTLMRIDTASGVLEIGHVNWSPLMQRTTAATEAIFLLLQHTFNKWGFRRCEWKCDSLNAPSRNAAMRMGFEHEGTFRQAVVTKGRNRDTDWFSITDKTWPRLQSAILSWLNTSNFDNNGKQIRRLQDYLLADKA
ncbi:MAG: GNAT family N-acetyltransferase [Oxalobacter formigenes]|nr:GNAT family N-acetyltransferase [Oxalobacter formigenes]